MNVYKELEEVGYNQIKLKNMTDNILDVYKKNPKQCENLLKELAKINKELEELDKEFSKYI
jgi:ABC-type Zn uptake system ZnuABC Zn-binding protein ZnuA